MELAISSLVVSREQTVASIPRPPGDEGALRITSDVEVAEPKPDARGDFATIFSVLFPTSSPGEGEKEGAGTQSTPDLSQQGHSDELLPHSREETFSAFPESAPTPDVSPALLFTAIFSSTEVTSESPQQPDAAASRPPILPAPEASFAASSARTQQLHGDDRSVVQHPLAVVASSAISLKSAGGKGKAGTSAHALDDHTQTPNLSNPLDNSLFASAVAPLVLASTLAGKGITPAALESVESDTVAEPRDAANFLTDLLPVTAPYVAQTIASSVDATGTAGVARTESKAGGDRNSPIESQLWPTVVEPYGALQAPTSQLKAVEGTQSQETIPSGQVTSPVQEQTAALHSEEIGSLDLAALTAPGVSDPQSPDLHTALSVPRVSDPQRLNLPLIPSATFSGTALADLGQDQQRTYPGSVPKLAETSLFGNKVLAQVLAPVPGAAEQTPRAVPASLTRPDTSFLASPPVTNDHVDLKNLPGHQVAMKVTEPSVITTSSQIAVSDPSVTAETADLSRITLLHDVSKDRLPLPSLHTDDRGESPPSVQQLTASVQAESHGVPPSSPLNSIRPTALAPTVVKRVAGEIVAQLDRGNNTAFIQLEPAELGKLRIDLTVTGDKVEVRILTEAPEVSALIQGHMMELKGALQEHSLDLGSVSVDVSAWTGDRGNTSREFPQQLGLQDSRGHEAVTSERGNNEEERRRRTPRQRPQSGVSVWA